MPHVPAKMVEKDEENALTSLAQLCPASTLETSIVDLLLDHSSLSSILPHLLLNLIVDLTSLGKLQRKT